MENIYMGNIYGEYIYIWCSSNSGCCFFMLSMYFTTDLYSQPKKACSNFFLYTCIQYVEVYGLFSMGAQMNTQNIGNSF